MSLLLQHSCPTLQFILLRVPVCGNRPWRRRGAGGLLGELGLGAESGTWMDRDGTREAAPLWWAQVLPGQSRLERTLGLTWRSHIGNHQAWAARLGVYGRNRTPTKEVRTVTQPCSTKRASNALMAASLEDEACSIIRLTLRLSRRAPRRTPSLKPHNKKKAPTLRLRFAERADTDAAPPSRLGSPTTKRLTDEF